MESVEEGQGGHPTGHRGLTARILIGMIGGFAVGLLLKAIGIDGLVWVRACEVEIPILLLGQGGRGMVPVPAGR